MRGRVLSALIAASIAATLFLSGCGSDDPGKDVVSVSGTGDKAAASAAPSEDPYQKSLKFAQCMRENGIDMADPEPGKGIMMKLDKNTPKETMDKAQEACKQYAPSGVRQGGGDPKMAENLRKVAQCMRDNGVENYPDPEGGAMRITGDVGEDPDFKSAQEKCQKELADAGMGGL
ncbi:hypothetical protein [Nonomuraea zeae]|uniref:Lipoprotein n=1 Tax=Nonomuraea zeae TaxID=1642303 RepID=A0A5S4GF94_9ACTN|nr:hypothetical protein [Nonomuraea zeae]TMR31653.1 hypothetical protein ETD85_25040 [Nonomuraea zeae]